MMFSRLCFFILLSISKLIVVCTIIHLLIYLPLAVFYILTVLIPFLISVPWSLSPIFLVLLWSLPLLQTFANCSSIPQLIHLKLVLPLLVENVPSLLLFVFQMYMMFLALCSFDAVNIFHVMFSIAGSSCSSLHNHCSFWYKKGIISILLRTKSYPAFSYPNSPFLSKISSCIDPMWYLPYPPMSSTSGKIGIFSEQMWSVRAHITLI